MPTHRPALGQCWVWTGFATEDGYGRFTPQHGDRSIGAHRFAWQLSRGPIPEDAWVLHDCDTPPCVNPAHLFLGEAAINNADMHAKGRRGRILVPTGDDHYSRREPWRLARGDRHGSHLHPERMERGTGRYNAKLTEEAVANILKRYTGKHGEQSALAREFGVSVTVINLVVRGLAWRHV